MIAWCGRLNGPVESPGPLVRQSVPTAKVLQVPTKSAAQRAHAQNGRRREHQKAVLGELGGPPRQGWPREKAS
jgi:hypothetical protein